MLLFFFNDTATTEIYTLSLHDALPISIPLASLRRARPDHCPERHPARITGHERLGKDHQRGALLRTFAREPSEDRKSTRLNSSHANISYAVFCLKKKNKQESIILSPPS